jgi:integrase
MVDPANGRRSFRHLCAKAGLDGSWHPHELRHTAASLGADAGRSTRDLGDLLGHAAGSRVAEDTYIHQLRPSDAAGAIEAALT